MIVFELSNEQRKCFGLPEVDPSWELIEVKPSPYDNFLTYAYLGGNRIRKVILINEDSDAGKPRYQEFQVNTALSDDKKLILPKTAKGKSRPLSSSTLMKCTAEGMCLTYSSGSLFLNNYSTEQDFIRFIYDDIKPHSFEDFVDWVDKWCAETGETEQHEIETFAKAKRVHQKYQEGDFFRFRLTRHLYGYGRLLINYDKMRKEKVPFWDIFMGKPLCVVVYHIATERDDMTPEELEGLQTLPPVMIMDNSLFYGEHYVIGNRPINEDAWDFPIHYGDTIKNHETGVWYQRGRTYVELDGEMALYDRFQNNGIGWNLNVNLPVLQKCIDTGSNKPYWDMYYPGRVDGDLRNPKYHKEFDDIMRQIGKSNR